MFRTGQEPWESKRRRSRPLPANLTTGLGSRAWPVPGVPVPPALWAAGTGPTWLRGVSRTPAAGSGTGAAGQKPASPRAPNRGPATLPPKRHALSTRVQKRPVTGTGPRVLAAPPCQALTARKTARPLPPCPGAGPVLAAGPPRRTLQRELTWARVASGPEEPKLTPPTCRRAHAPPLQPIGTWDGT